MNWSGNFREGLAREIRENKTLAKITAYTVLEMIFVKYFINVMILHVSLTEVISKKKKPQQKPVYAK